jgi:uncharacterized membrane protein YtjA (UPF0391 family)
MRVFGFTGIAVSIAYNAKIFFFIFLGLFLLSLIGALFTGRKSEVIGETREISEQFK